MSNHHDYESGDASLAHARRRSAEITAEIAAAPSRFRVLSGDRPTGEPHDEQKRLSSGTDGLASTAVRGSATGAAGTFVMPAPRCKS